MMVGHDEAPRTKYVENLTPQENPTQFSEPQMPKHVHPLYVTAIQVHSVARMQELDQQRGVLQLCNEKNG